MQRKNLKTVNIINEDFEIIYTHVQFNNSIRATLEKAVKENISLGGAVITHADLSEGDFRCADFQGVDFTHSTFEGADLRHATFEFSDLVETNFADANLQDVDFSFAMVININLTRANVQKVTMHSDATYTGTIIN